MTKNKRFTCEVVDTGLFHIERITDTLENNTFSDVETVTDLLNNFNEEVEQLKKCNSKAKNHIEDIIFLLNNTPSQTLSKDDLITLVQKTKEYLE